MVLKQALSALTLGAILPAHDPVRLPAPNTGYGITGDRVLMQNRVEVIPLGTQWSSLLRVTLAPGTVWELGQQRYDDDGPQLYQVASGSLTIQAEQPISITPAGAATAERLLPHTEVVLHPGDAGFTPAGIRSTWRNDGQEPVEVLHVKLSLVGFDGSCVSPPPGVSITPLIEQRKWEQPDHPILVTLRQVTLDSRAVLPVEAVPGLELLYVVSGTLSVHDPPQADEPSSLLVPRFDRMGHPSRKGAAAKGTFRQGRVLHSSADEGAVLLLLTIAPAEPATDPSALTQWPGEVPAPHQFLATNQGFSGAQHPEVSQPLAILLDGAASCIGESA